MAATIDNPAVPRQQARSALIRRQLVVPVPSIVAVGLVLGPYENVHSAIASLTVAAIA